MKIATVAQIREMDLQTIEKFHLPALVLTENAALGVIDVLRKRFGPLRGKYISLVCGRGNNGGDGLAIARHLSGCFGARVSVWLFGKPIEGASVADHECARAFGLVLREAENINLQQAELVIDALFGTGIRGAVTGAAGELIRKMNECGKPIIAVDIASGLDADTGKADGAVVQAAITVTFSLPKFGLLEFPGAACTGELVVADIGVPKILRENTSLNSNLTETADIASWLPARVNGRDANKGMFGHVVILAGAEGYTGAAVLAAEAAARGGAGLVTLAVPKEIQASVMAHVSPVVVTRGLKQSIGGAFAADALEAALALTRKASVAALGPGLGRARELGLFVREFVARCSVPLVIDADALNLIAQEPEQGALLIKGRRAPTVLTPHPGEMGRLLGVETSAVQENRREAALQASVKFGCVVLLKGARTLIAAPDGTLYLNPTGNPGMASGGVGDVLTGLVAALFAQQLEPLHAAVAGAYIHGLAGDLVTDSQGGATGLIAADLPARFPEAIALCQNYGKIVPDFPRWPLLVRDDHL